MLYNAEHKCFFEISFIRWASKALPSSNCHIVYKVLYAFFPLGYYHHSTIKIHSSWKYSPFSHFLCSRCCGCCCSLLFFFCFFRIFLRPIPYIIQYTFIKIIRDRLCGWEIIFGFCFYVNNVVKCSSTILFDMFGKRNEPNHPSIEKLLQNFFDL